MTRTLKVLIALVCMGAGIMIAVYWWYTHAIDQAAEENFKDQLGSYVLDIKKTRLGGYSKDSALYQGLTLTFHADSTFTMSMGVPFVYDSVGRWRAAGGGSEQWNSLSYSRNPAIETQFGECCAPDSTFYLNSTTPREGQEFIQEIYFKKISR